jgi:hypothetical protein
MIGYRQDVPDPVGSMGPFFFFLSLLFLFFPFLFFFFLSFLLTDCFSVSPFSDLLLF